MQSFWDPSSGEGDLLHHSNTMAPGREQASSFVSEQGHEHDASGRETEAASQAAVAGEEADEAAGPPPGSSATGRQRGAGAPPGSPSALQKATTGRGSHYCGPESCSSSSSLLAMVAGRTDGAAGVLYPFAVVKPLVLDDGGTLRDVNRRILKRPARPVRHPVGQFACGPVVKEPSGPGLSGKAVVSLTKIRTGGKGTITIIRTRG